MRNEIIEFLLFLLFWDGMAAWHSWSFCWTSIARRCILILV